MQVETSLLNVSAFYKGISVDNKCSVTVMVTGKGIVMVAGKGIVMVAGKGIVMVAGKGIVMVAGKGYSDGGW